MKKYFYAEGTNSQGPFSLDELSMKGIYPNTLIWFEGLDGWKKASEVAELNSLFRQYGTPPPPNHFTGNQDIHQIQEPYSKPPKTWLVESILVTLFCCLPFGIAGIVNATKVETLFYAGNQAGALKASQNAKKWITVSMVLGGIIFAAYMLYFIVLLAVGDVR